MIKKNNKRQKNSAEKKSTINKNRGAKKASKKREPNPAKVQKDLALLVESKARKMVEAVISRGMSGQVAPVKFALEVANIHPHSMDANQSTSEEDCLAKTLLDRLGIPSSPVIADEYEKEDTFEIPARPAGAERDDEAESGKATEVGADTEATPEAVVGGE